MSMNHVSCLIHVFDIIQLCAWVRISMETAVETNSTNTGSCVRNSTLKVNSAFHTSSDSGAKGAVNQRYYKHATIIQQESQPLL